MKSLVKSLTGLRNEMPISYAPSWVNKAFPSTSRRQANTESFMGAMGSVGTLFAIVNRTSNATAQVDWKLWRSSVSGDKEDRVQVTKHLALQVFNKPNAFYTRQEFVESSQQHVDLTGESYWVVAKYGSMPSELWPVRPDKITPIPDKENYLAGYQYMDPDGKRIFLEVDEVIQLRMPNPLDPYRGMGPVQSILTDLDSVRYSAEWNRNFFLNSAEPGGIIELEDKLSNPDFQQFTQRWREQHQGIANAHRVAVIEKARWVNRTFTMRDMQFAELRAVSREIIREAFGIHPHMLGLSETVNRANADAAEVTFARWMVKPRLERIKGALNNDFLPMFGASGQGLEFDYCDFEPEDEELNAKVLASKAQAAKDLSDAGYDKVGILNAVGLPEIAIAEVEPVIQQVIQPVPNAAIEEGV